MGQHISIHNINSSVPEQHGPAVIFAIKKRLSISFYKTPLLKLLITNFTAFNYESLSINSPDEGIRIWILQHSNLVI